MKMRLQEAKELLRRAGYLVRSLNEDTETNDDEFDELEDKQERSWRGDGKFTSKDSKRLSDIEFYRHPSLKDKIRSAKRFNAKDIETVDDIIKWIVDETETTKDEIDVTDDYNLIIKPAFEGDGKIFITIDPDGNRIFIKHEFAPAVKSNGLSLNAFEDAWNRMTSKVY